MYTRLLYDFFQARFEFGEAGAAKWISPENATEARNLLDKPIAAFYVCLHGNVSESLAGQAYAVRRCKST